jgi:hypothetical protein
MTSDEISHFREQIDLLVDGELEESQRRALLLNLDATPGGWKQCAIAFLEAQMFKQSLRQWRGRVTPAHPTAQIAVNVSKQPQFRRSPMILIMILLVFLGGVGLSGYWFRQSQELATHPVLDNTPDLPDMAGTLTFPVVETPRPTITGNEFAVFQSPTVASPFVTAASKFQRVSGPLRTENVTLPREAGMSTMTVPCYLASDIEADRYLKSPQKIAPN